MLAVNTQVSFLLCNKHRKRFLYFKLPILSKRPRNTIKTLNILKTTEGVVTVGFHHEAGTT